MSESTKRRILILLSQVHHIVNPHEMQQPIGNDTHTIVHDLYTMRRQGLVTFRTGVKIPTWKGKPSIGGVSKKIPHHIEITAQGRRYLDRKD